jgi:hypothetical protein
MRFVVLVAALIWCGCSHPAPDAGFITTPSLLQPDKMLPFDAVWGKDGIDLRAYKKIYVAPVDVTYLLKMSWWDKFTISQAIPSKSAQAQSTKLAEYMRNSVIRVFKDDKTHGYQVLDQPDKETLMIELALVEIVPTKVWLNSVSYVIAGALDTGATAMEGRFRDSASAEVVFSFKDKRAGPYSIVNIKDLTPYGHAKGTIDDWANELEEVCGRSPDQVISSPFPFTLKPW